MLKYLIFGLFAFVAQAQAQSPLLHQAVYGGRPVIWPQDIPSKYVVGFMQNGQVFCTGLLIDKHTVLTAAHCFLPMGKQAMGGERGFRRFQQKTMAIFVRSKGQAFEFNSSKIRFSERSIRSVTLHPEYEDFFDRLDEKQRKLRSSDLLNLNMESEREKNERKRLLETTMMGIYRNDIAIVKLWKRAPSDFSISELPRAYDERWTLDRACRYELIGFGLEEAHQFPKYQGLRSAKTATAGPSQLSIWEDFINVRGNPSLCRGDSGGPLLEFCGSSVRVVGIASHADVRGPKKCAKPDASSNYVRTDRHLDWINTHK